MRGAVVLCVALTAHTACGGPFSPSWQSLSRHRVPEWFRDAKLGIYTHWGPVTVGAEHGPSGVQWYGRNMYISSSPVFAYHRKRFGEQKTFGYKDVVNLFKARRFDPDAWAALFAATGAKFAGPVAIHHDNFAMWDSKLTQWDSVDKGPHRDITGELARAYRKRGMRFMASFHHAFTWRYFEPAYKYDGADPRYVDLYCEPHKEGAPPTEHFQKQWLEKVKEVVLKYEPELIWFDFGLGGRNCITEKYRLAMFSFYYNWGAAHGKEVGVAHKHRSLHRYTGILDFERGREDRLTPYPWLTDTSVGPWFHQESARFRSPDNLVDVCVDIVSKNGCLLLNVGPRADGTIPHRAVKLLKELGAWLRVNGEAVYRTRPFLTYGEGPTRSSGGAFSERKDRAYTWQDLRFTRVPEKTTWYVIALAWPESEVVVNSVKVKAAPGATVHLLGYPGTLHYEIDTQGRLHIKVPSLPPEKRPCRHAFSFRLRGFSAQLR